MQREILTPCNGLIVGMLVIEPPDKILLVRRKNFPFGFSPPAGHLKSGEEPEDGARREVEEKTGLEITNTKLIWFGRKESPCRRGMNHHNLYVFRTTEWKGKLALSQKETSIGSGWYDKVQLEKLAQKSHGFSGKYQIPIRGINIVELSRKLSEDMVWINNPGLELVWVDIMSQLSMI